MSTLREIIHESVREGELYEKLDRNWVRCFACGHCCKIPDGQPGVCKVRYNRGGTVCVPWGYDLFFAPNTPVGDVPLILVTNWDAELKRK
jgi:hypothetical protein